MSKHEKQTTDWSSISLGDVIQTIRAGTSANSDDREFGDGDRGVLTLSAVAAGQFNPGAFKVAAMNEHGRLRTPVRANTILFTRKNTPDLVGQSAVVTEAYPHLYLPDLIWELTVSENCDAHWLNLWFQSSAFRKHIPYLAAGSSQSMVGIAQDNLLSVPLELPPADEQRRIVAVLDAWMRSTQIIERLVAAKEFRFAAARQQLIEDRQASRHDENEWRPVELAELTFELTTRNTGRFGADKVMGVIKSEGLVPMRAHVMASDLTRYKVVPPRAFAYNPMRLNIGSIAASNHAYDVLVSPDYVVFQARPSAADPQFLRLFIGTKKWRDHLAMAGTGSVRTRIYYDALAEMVLRVPSLEQQQRIGAALARLERDLTASKAMLDALRAQKRGLIQKLLTGERRLDERFDPAPLLASAAAPEQAA